MNRRVLLLAIALAASFVAPVRAHFLFIRILPPAEGGRAAEVYFSELAEAGDPRFVDKIAHTQLWLQTAPGKYESLKVHKAPDRLRAWLPYTGNLMVVGECRYGVIARPKATPFLLRHYPKAIAGNPEALNKLSPHGKLPLEIAVTVDRDALHLTALRNGKPVPNAEFVTIDAQLKNVKLTADAEGQATWKPPTAGDYSIYTRSTSKKTGEFDGKKYEEIRDFATVALTWPLERKDADADAVARFEEALATRAAWKNFPGFTAHITGNLEGRSFAGAIAVDAQGKVDFTDDAVDGNEAVSSWVQDQFESIVLHRLARPTSGEARKPVLRFGDSKDDHPLGRLLIFDGGQFASSYRVKDKQILVVNRHVGKENMTITVLDNDRNAEGLFLPRSYTVQYWDAASGELKRIETVQQRWQRLGSWDLPAQQTVTTATAAGLSVRSFTLTKHQLAKDEPLKGAIIVVDPGHGGQRYSKSYTGGTRGVVSRLTESELNLRVAVELAKRLKEKGATVYMTREADHRLSPEGSSNTAELHARIDFFEHYNAHFFLSVHHNAGGGGSSGHTTLYKHNAKDDTLYESLAQDINDALEGAVPGPKLKLIKGSYHILRETSIPGTISESGFMTNRAFDELSTKPDYPKKEAEAICKGAIKYWTGHKDALVALRETLMQERAAHPRDPKSYTAIDLNPEFQARMKKLVAQVAPDGKNDPAKIGEYVENFKKVVVTDPKVTFTVKGEFDGQRLKLSGETSERKYHDQLIDLLIAMKLYNIANEIRFPKTP